jgi:PIN domain nuclease of toxin-antitoxin system
MASLTYLDTHVAAWLYEGRVDLLSPSAVEVLERDDLRVSPMVVLEFEFLREVGRFRDAGAEVVHALEAQLGLEVCDLDFRRVIDAALELQWTRDPFDRVIVGHALAAQGRLLTRDETIRAGFVQSVW